MAGDWGMLVAARWLNVTSDQSATALHVACRLHFGLVFGLVSSAGSGTSGAVLPAGS
jgi:hypothetical protein